MSLGSELREIFDGRRASWRARITDTPTLSARAASARAISPARQSLIPADASPAPELPPLPGARRRQLWGLFGVDHRCPRSGLHARHKP